MPIEPDQPLPAPQAPLPVIPIGLDETAPSRDDPALASGQIHSGGVQTSDDPSSTAPSVRFCRTCGDPWDPTLGRCPRCAARAQRQGDAKSAESVFRSDQRRVKSAIALYFCLLGVSIVSMVVLSAEGKGDVGDSNIVVGAEIAMAIITLAWCIPFAKDLKPLLGRIPRPQWFALAVLIAIGTMLLAQGVVGLLHHVLGVPELEYLKNLARDGYGFDWAILLICVQPAIIEELAFRGVILTSLEPVIGKREALLVSALMFAILHLSIPSLPHLLVLGMLLAWLRQRTGSMYPGMLLHFTHNFLVLLVEHNRSLIPW